MKTETYFHFFKVNSFSLHFRQVLVFAMCAAFVRNKDVDTSVGSYFHFFFSQLFSIAFKQIVVFAMCEAFVENRDAD